MQLDRQHQEDLQGQNGVYGLHCVWPCNGGQVVMSLEKHGALQQQPSDSISLAFVILRFSKTFLTFKSAVAAVTSFRAAVTYCLTLFYNDAHSKAGDHR